MMKRIFAYTVIAFLGLTSIATADPISTAIAAGLFGLTNATAIAITTPVIGEAMVMKIGKK